MFDKELKDYLIKQKEEKFTFEDVNKLELAHKLIKEIGHEDSEIRDDLIYPNLGHLLYDNHLEPSELEDILELLVSPRYLFFDLDNDITYSVLTRSFTTLQLVLLVAVYNRDNNISKFAIDELFKTFLDYFNQEQNLKGYNDEVGFMHAIAHSADLFHQFAQVEHFTETHFLTMLNAISKKFKREDYYFMHDEDERMVKAIKAMLDRKIIQEENLIYWIESLSKIQKPTSYPEVYYLTNNVKNLLRSLYFSILKEEEYKNVTTLITEVLDKL